jgi:tetrahydromethanopterin S-methyltransferase subunit F
MKKVPVKKKGLITRSLRMESGIEDTRKRCLRMGSGKEDA